MKLTQIRINLQGDIVVRDINVKDYLQRYTKTFRIYLPLTHENVLNRKYVEKGSVNQILGGTGLDIMAICEPEKFEGVLKMVKEERIKLLEGTLIPELEHSLYSYQVELNKLKESNKKEEVTPCDAAPCEDVAKPVEEQPKVEEAPVEEAPVEEPTPKKRGRRKKEVTAAPEGKKSLEEMTLAELKAECAKAGIIPETRNKEKIIQQLMAANI